MDGRGPGRRPGARGPSDPYRPFVARAARLVGRAMAVLLVAGLTLLAVVLPDSSTGERGLGDRLGLVVFALAGAWLLLRHAHVRADPDPDGLTVRNLVRTRRLAWAEVVSVRFGDRPWVQLDLDDGTTLAVMAIQAADGARARAEARRLATLVARHSPTPDR